MGQKSIQTHHACTGHQLGNLEHEGQARRSPCRRDEAAWHVARLSVHELVVHVLAVVLVGLPVWDGRQVDAAA